MSNIHTYIKIKKLSNNDIAKALGYSPEHISRILTGATALNHKFLGKFKEAYPDFDNNVNPLFIENINDLPDNVLQEPSTLYQLDSQNDIIQVPFSDFMETAYLPIEAQAGYLDSLEGQEVAKLDTMLIPREFEKGNYLIVELKGDSMNDGSYRAILDKDKLLCKELSPVHWKNKLHFNQYLFVIAAHDGVVCKQITGHNKESGDITCHSWNPFYKDYVINLQDVYKLFYVKKIVDRGIRF